MHCVGDSKYPIPIHPIKIDCRPINKEVIGNKNIVWKDGTIFQRYKCDLYQKTPTFLGTQLLYALQIGFCKDKPLTGGYFYRLSLIQT